MPYATKEELKSRFEVGDTPTQKDFEDLLDSCHNGLFESPKVLEGIRIGTDNIKGKLTVNDYLPSSGVPYDNTANITTASLNTIITGSTAPSTIAYKFAVNDNSKNGELNSPLFGIFCEIQRPITNNQLNTYNSTPSPVQHQYSGYFRAAHFGNGTVFGLNGVLGRAVLASSTDGATVTNLTGGSFVSNISAALNAYTGTAIGCIGQVSNAGTNSTINQGFGVVAQVYNKNNTAGKNSIIKQQIALVCRLGTDVDKTLSPTSTIDWMYGVKVENYSKAHNVINFHGFYCSNDDAGINDTVGTCQNYYGIYLSNGISAAKITNKRFGIYQADVNSKNVFRGRVYITKDGTDTLLKNNVQLQVEGLVTQNLKLDTLSTADVSKGSFWTEVNPAAPDTQIRFKLKGSDGVIRSSAWINLLPTSGGQQF